MSALRSPMAERAPRILMLMHLAIGAITYTALVKIAPAAPARNEPGRDRP